MRESLTLFAILLIIVLSAALAVPYFVDWNAERSVVEAQLSELLGQPVKVRGGIDLKLLPTPYLQLANIDVADPAAGIDVKAAELHLEISLTALMRGEVDFVQARLLGPQVHLRLQNGAISLRQPMHAFSKQMQFERISVEDGGIVVDDAATGRSFALKKIALSAEARSLAGPFNGEGHFEATNEPTAFRFSTAKRQGDELHFKLIVDQNKEHPRAEIDANLIFHPNTTALALPSVKGKLDLSGRTRGEIALPWQLAGFLDGDLHKATVSNIDLHLGDADHVTGLAGDAKFDLGAKPRAEVALKAEQIDLDRLLAAPNAQPALQRLVTAFIDGITLADPVSVDFPVNFEFSGDSVLLGGETLSDVGLNLAVSNHAASKLRFTATGPERSRLVLDGNVESGNAAAFKGHVEASSDDVARFGAWLKANLPQTLPAGFDLPARAVNVSGHAEISEVGFVGDNLTLRLDGSTLTGALAYTKSLGPTAARFFADLSAPSLDIARLPDFSFLVGRVKGMDLALRLDARAVKLGGLQQGQVDAGRIKLKFDQSGGVAVLNNLTVSDLGGADLTASGRWDGHVGTTAVKLDADRLADLGNLVKRFVPGPAAEFLAARADALSPAHLDLDAHVKAMEKGAIGLDGLTLSGTAGQTKIAAHDDRDPQSAAGQFLSLRVDAPDAAALLRQIGFAALSTKQTGAGSIALKAHGVPGQSFATSLMASLAGIRVDFRGTTDPNFADPRAQGTVELASANLSSFLRATGQITSDPHMTFPLELTGAIDAGHNRLALTKLKGNIAGSKIAGDLAFAGGAGVTGSLDIDKASLASFMGLATGPAQPAKPGEVWSATKFAAPVVNPPLTNIMLRVEDFALWPQISGRDARFDLALSGDAANLQVGLRNLSMKIGTGNVSGDLKLRRSGATAAAEAHVSLNNCALVLSSMQGRLSGNLDLAGTGESPAALIAGLAGTGTLKLSDVVVPKSDPGALTRVVNAVEEDRLGIDATQMYRVLASEFDKQSLFLGGANFEATIAAGNLRLINKKEKGSAPEQGAVDGLEATFDLDKLTLTQSATMSLAALPKNWSGAAPQITLNWQGPIANPTRNFDASSFVNALAARAIARESARIQAQEFDIREQAFFVARLDFERRREQEKQRAALEELRRAEAARLEQEKQDALKDLQTTGIPAAPLQLGQPAPGTSPPAAPPPSARGAPQDPTAAGRY